MGHHKGNPEREVHSITALPKEDRKKSEMNNLTLHLKELEKQQPTKPRVSRRKEITKIRAELQNIRLQEQL